MLEWKPRFYIFIIFIISAISSFCVFSSTATQLTIQGAIGPATADYLSRGIEAGQKSDLIIIQIDTPGGLIKSTRQIIQAMLNSKVPIVGYVTPSGARAASAGTFLLYASTVAAMTPGTHLGAASPVSLMGGMSDKNTSSMDKKLMNDTKAYIRTLAQIRGRNIKFAEESVAIAATMTANEALKVGVINLIAIDKTALLDKLDGMDVTQDNRVIKLETKNIKIKEINPDLRTRILLVITDPTIAYLLLILGIYGIFFELMNPGFIAPGVIGAIALLVALYALQMLPISYAGLFLVLLGISLVIAEAFATSFGVLGVGGTTAFVIGSFMLFDTTNPSYQIAWSAIWAVALTNVVIFITAFSVIIRSRRQPAHHGLNNLVGEAGRALTAINPVGQAFVRGEIWSVYSANPIKIDSSIRVIGFSGIQLEVELIV